MKKDGRRNKLYKTSETKFKEAVAECFSVAQVLKKLDLCEFGSAYKTFKDRVKDLNLDTSHFTGQASNKGKTFTGNKLIPLKEILVEESTYSRVKLKERLIENNILEDKCNICGISEWNGKKLTLHLDHINGVNNCNKIENLQLVCPNCDSLSEFYCGRNIKKKPGKNPRYDGDKLITPNACQKCEKEIPNRRDQKYCNDCYNSNRKELQTPYKITYKVVRPSKEVLAKLLWEKPTMLLAKDFGVSDVAIAKWAKAYGLEKPPRGYWRKKETGNL